MRNLDFARRLFAIASFAIGLPMAALAQQPQTGSLPPEASNPAVRDAWAKCNADIQKFCPNLQPGGGRIVRCLVANASSLTPECRAGMTSAKSALGR